MKSVKMSKTFAIALCVTLSLHATLYSASGVPNQKLYPFEAKAVQLTDGIFHRAMQLDMDWLISLEPDRFLSGFRTEAGLEPRAPKYGGWENSGVTGSAFGHYMSAASRMYAMTGNKTIRERLDYIIAELDMCSEKIGTGYLAGFPGGEKIFAEIARGDIRAAGFDLNGGWVPLYTIHKMFAGLIDVYIYTGNKQCLKVVTAMADWMDGVFEGLTDQQVQQVLISEHGGINESMAELYAITGEERYLRLAERLCHRAVMDPLSVGEDRLANLHANMQIPKIVGAAHLYRLTGDEYDYRVADNFWKIIVRNHTYVIGGNSEAEHLGRPHMLSDRISPHTCETCNTYNMLKLTRELFMFSPDAEKADYYERALYNQILASQHPQTGMICYMSPMESGSRKQFCSPFETFWCCVGTSFENHMRYGEFIYFSDASDNLYVNLFIPSRLKLEKRGIQVTQQTRFPESDTMQYSVNLHSPQRFSINLRLPGWAQNGYSVSVNGRKVTTETDAKGYISIERKWREGDKITYIVPRSLRSEAVHGDPTVCAYLYGPVVLCSLLEVGQNIPVIVTDSADFCSLITPVAPDDGLRFRTERAYPRQIDLVPYYIAADSRMMIYFNHFTPQQWVVEETSYYKRRQLRTWTREEVGPQFADTVMMQWVAEQTLSVMDPDSSAHRIRGENCKYGEIEGRKYIESKEGWFSFDMNVQGESQLYLVCKYWGGLVYNYGFDILIDDEYFAFDNIHNWGGRFVDRIYKIPMQLTMGKESVRVTFRAGSAGLIAGPLFECSIMK